MSRSWAAAARIISGSLAMSCTELSDRSAPSMRERTNVSIAVQTVTAFGVPVRVGFAPPHDQAFCDPARLVHQQRARHDHVQRVPPVPAGERGHPHHLLAEGRAAGGEGPQVALGVEDHQAAAGVRDQVGNDDPDALTRTCTDQFIPALVDARAAADVPAGIKQAVASDRDGTIAQAKTEWATDSTDANFEKMCSQPMPEADAKARRGDRLRCQGGLPANSPNAAFR